MTPASLEWLARFRRYLNTERRLSPHTDAAYARDLAALVRFCDKHQLRDWNALDTQYVRTFAASAHAQGLSPRSIQRRLSALRTFFAFLLRESHKEAGVVAAPRRHRARLNPARDVRAPKARRALPRTLDADQMASLLKLAPGGALTTRDRAIMELFYSSGLRLAELVALDLASLDFKEQLVRVTGKGSKARIVPVGRMAVAALKGWLNERADLARADETALFVGRNGRRLGARAVQLRVAYWARAQGLNVPVHPHLFRHSFASHLLESSGELRGVQELLGHANLSTTQIYTHLDFQHLARIYDATHPRARRKA
jgi:integrase/recombinase XerC